MTDNKLRPCYVGNEKALFHGWIEETKLFLEIQKWDSTENINAKLRAFKTDCVAFPHSELKTQTQTVALVEFENGIVRKVEPSDVVFADDKTSEYKSFFE